LLLEEITRWAEFDVRRKWRLFHKYLFEKDQATLAMRKILVILPEAVWI